MIAEGKDRYLWLQSHFFCDGVDCNGLWNRVLFLLGRKMPMCSSNILYCIDADSTQVKKLGVVL